MMSTVHCEHDEETVDLLVVGFELAGASAALEAAAARASVTVIEALDGGGASALSGGQLYLGGGTRYQREAGFEDSPERMFEYLTLETRGAVSPRTLADCVFSPRRAGRHAADRGAVRPQEAMA